MAYRTGKDVMLDLSWKTIYDTMKKYEIMADTLDFKTHLLLLEYLNPSSIWELGAGRGSWCLGLHELIDNKNICYNLVEDFSWSKNGYDKLFVDYFWPKDINELDNFIKNTESNINYKIFDGDILNFKENFTNIEFIRIDCDLPNTKDTINILLKNSDNNLVILLDDIKANRAFYRLFDVSKFVEENKLKIILTANETVVLAKQQFDVTNLYQHCLLYKEKFKNITFIDDFMIFNKQAGFLKFRD